MAHMVMLVEQKIVDRGDAGKVFSVLKNLLNTGAGAVDTSSDFEDIHMAIEAYIIREAGDAGGRLHTGRSRNDQVACDLRMKARDDVLLLSKALTGLVSALLEVAEQHSLTLLPAYTHMQRAQPTTVGHHLSAYAESLLRSLDRLEDAYVRVDLCPLGAAAVTTTSYPLNRERTAELLGFTGVLRNSMDAVSSRDYMAEIAAATAIISVDISRICEELIVWSTSEFSFIELDDSHASTSSIMPQKKNPDILEITRARTASAFGGLISVLTMLRSLPQSYNRDLQEVSPVFFNTIDSVSSSLVLLSRVVASMKINSDVMNAACMDDFLTATELADVIVRKKDLPFRTAHQIVGALVSQAISEGVMPSSVTTGFVDRAAESVTGEKLGLSDEVVTAALTPLVAVEARRVLGGPAPEVVEQAVAHCFDRLAQIEQSINLREEGINKSRKTLLAAVESILEA
ncbi:argininosuccinate lyase 1 [archaeon BMS3Abin16]|nr:argininosuccinate lyase 1 [archaeon BMS3Abin16]